MAVRTVLAISITISVLTALQSRVALAEPAALEPGVVELLTLGEHYSPHSLAAARKQHEHLSKLKGYDARVRYAFALVLIKQRSSDESLHALDAVLAQQPDLLPAWRAKIWAQMSARKYVAAIHSMQTAATVMEEEIAKLASAGTSDDPNAPERGETARFFGRMFGFLEGPRGHAIAAAELRKSKQQIQSKLGDDREAFAEGEEAIAAQFVKVHERVQESESKAAAQTVEQEAHLKQQQTKVDKAESEVDFESEKLQTTTKTQLEDIVKQADPIQKNIAQTQFRLTAVDQAIIAQQGQATLQNEMLKQPGSVNAFARAAAVQQLNLIQNNVQQLLVQRGALVMQIGGLNEQLGALAARRAALLGEGAQTAANLKTQAAQLKRKEKELERAQKTAAKHRTSPSPKSEALTEQQQAFGTYEPFPFDAEKDRVLSWFRQ